MMHAQRMGQSVFITVTALGDLALWAWLLLVDHGPRWPLVLAAALIGLSPAVITVLFVRHDLLAERGKALGQMASAGYVLEEEDAPIKLLWGLITIPHTRPVWWIDSDGDGKMDPGETLPRVVSIRQRATEHADAGFIACRDVLKWAYEQDAAKLSWGQIEGHRHFGPTRYDYAFAVFATMGLVEGRRKRVQGRLVWPTYQAALDTLKEKWNEGGGYVSAAANLGVNRAER